MCHMRQILNLAMFFSKIINFHEKYKNIGWFGNAPQNPPLYGKWLTALCMASQPEARQLATLLSLAYYPHCDVYKIQCLNNNLALSSKYI